jgi:dipeptidyl aminopeptidase/acylaminoacyl peptidase
MTDTLQPDAHLRIDGIPPIPRTLADRLARYTAFAPVDVLAWHPTRRALLVTRRHGATTQLHLLDGPMGVFDPLTDEPDPVLEASFRPHDGACLVFARDRGGDEAAQLYRHDAHDRSTMLLTDPSKKHGAAVWNHAGTAICFTSLPLDRHAGASDAGVVTELSMLDPREPDTCRTITRLEGGGWQNLQWSPDDRTLYATETRSVTDSTIWSIDVASGALTRVRPTDDARTIAYAHVHPTRDGRRLVYASDEDGEFRQLTVLDLASGERRVLTLHLPWDVVAIELQGGDHDHAAELAAAIVDVAGRLELHVFNLDSGHERALPMLPSVARAGSVTRVRFGSIDRDEIAFVVDSARSPGDVYSVRLLGDTPAVQWTRAEVDGIDTSAWREAVIVRWTSFDGLEITGLLNRPPARFTGKRPVLIHIHGGPESQATIGFLGPNNHFVDDLGIAYLQPNVRGSTGYGKTFVTLDDGLKREDSVKDIGALLDWIALQPDLDASRVLVAGRSYGGFMSLAVATMYADRIAASIDIVGISDFTSFLERTETYRRDLRRVEYGDERDPEVRAFFDRISPLANAGRIAKPLLVVAGRNDPRVPWQEGAQIVAKVGANGVPVWSIVADNEGHVFRRKANIDFVFCAQAMFVQRFLLE